MLYDLRHYFGTMLYAQTRDISYVKEKMGHSKLETTMIYTKLVALPSERNICKAAETVGGKGLIEVGFEYVCEQDGLKFFRKRKGSERVVGSSVVPGAGFEPATSRSPIASCCSDP